MQKILVDGYNVIHADPVLKTVLASDLEGARRGLVRRLQGYIGRRKIQITVVFDGAGSLSDVESVVPGRLQLVYTPEGQSADELIVKTLEDAPNARAYVVVTSDMADIGRRAGELGARVVSSGEFVGRIARESSGEADATGAEKPDPEDEDVDYWLEKFDERESDDP